MLEFSEENGAGKNFWVEKADCITGILRDDLENGTCLSHGRVSSPLDVIYVILV
jgi:hypothetical protein